MNALLVLYAGEPSARVLEPVIAGKTGPDLALERSLSFPGVRKTLVLGGPGSAGGDLAGRLGTAGIVLEREEPWTVRAILEAVGGHSAGFDFTYLAWADCPFPDPALAGRLAERHLGFRADYTYADLWPTGLAPELLAPETPAALLRLLDSDGNRDGGRPRRDSLFALIRRDVNAFDIETELSSIDMTAHRIGLHADSRRNVALLRNLAESAGGIPDAERVVGLVTERPELLRTLPAFYPIQVYGGCPQSCRLCPYPLASALPVTQRTDFMELRDFRTLLDAIADFSGDAVIGLSLWGEISLHPQKIDLIRAVLDRPALSLVVETSGIGWKDGELREIAELVGDAGPRTGGKPPVSWIVSLDSADRAGYERLRGPGFAEANDRAEKLLALFPGNAYVQMLKIHGGEEDAERFFRFWENKGAPEANIIIQKYDDFCGYLERLQAGDLSPLRRLPCRHIMRDMPILIDGTVPLCRERIGAETQDAAVLGNAFGESLAAIWERGTAHYLRQAEGRSEAFCERCDEFYTYNF